MPISEKDLEFMKQVVAYFESTKSPVEPEGSIQDTAQHFNINRAKVRKILITAGLIRSPITEAAIALREQGLSIQEIAATLGYSASTVSMYLPYADKVDNSLAPSPHAAEVREYRAYERQQQEREAKKRDQAQKELGVVKGERMAVYPVKVIFLSENHIALSIQNWLLRPLVMLEHQIFESFSVVCTFTRQVFEYSH